MKTEYLQTYDLTNLKLLSSVLGKELIFVDLEATGLVHERHFSIIEIGVVLITPSTVVEKSALVDPLMPIPSYITQLTGITNEMVKGKKTFKHFQSFFEQTAKTHIFCGFNSKSFDATGIIKMARKNGTFFSFDNQLDVRYLFLRNRNALLGENSQKGSLTDASNFYNVRLPKGEAHRAAYDIALTVLLAEQILHYHGLDTISPDVEKLKCEHTKNKYRHYIQQIHTQKS